MALNLLTNTIGDLITTAIFDAGVLETFPKRVGVSQAFFFNITWVHVRGECLPNLEFFS